LTPEHQAEGRTFLSSDSQNFNIIILLILQTICLHLFHIYIFLNPEVHVLLVYYSLLKLCHVPKNINPSSVLAFKFQTLPMTD